MDRFINFHELYLFDSSTKLFLSKESKRIVNPYSKDFRRSIRNSDQLVNNYLNSYQGRNVYSILSNSSGNATTIHVDLGDKAKPSIFLLCLSCNQYCSNHQPSMSTHSKSCNAQSKGAAKVNGYSFNLGKKLCFLVLKDPLASDLSPPTTTTTVPSVELPNPRLSEYSVGALDPETQIADIVVSESHLLDLMKNLQESDGDCLNDICNRSEVNTNHLGLFQKCFEYLWKQLNRSNHINAILTHSLLLEATTAKGKSPNWLNTLDKSSDRYCISFIKLLNVILIIYRHEWFSKMLSQDQIGSLDAVKEILKSSETVGGYSKELVEKFSDTLAKLFADLIATSDIIFSATSLCFVNLFMDETQTIRTKSFATHFLKSRFLDGIIYIIKLLISRGYTLNNSNDNNHDKTNFEHFINDQTQMSRLINILHLRKVAKTAERNSYVKKSIQVVGGDTNIIQIENTLFKRTNLREMALAVETLFKKELNILQEKFELDLPSIEHVENYLDTYCNINEQFGNTSPGWSVLASIPDDKSSYVTNVSQGFLKAAKSNPMDLLKKIQAPALHVLFPAMFFIPYGMARGTEIASTTFANTTELPRSCFYSGQLHLQVTKNSATTLAHSFVLRTVPTELKRLIYYYIHVLRRLEKQVLLLGGYNLDKDPVVTNKKNMKMSFEDLEVDDESEDEFFEATTANNITGSVNNVVKVKVTKPQTINDLFNTVLFLDGIEKLSPNKRSALVKHFIAESIPESEMLNCSALSLRQFRHILIYFERMIVKENSGIENHLFASKIGETSANHSYTGGISNYANDGDQINSASSNYVISELSNIWHSQLFGSATSDPTVKSSNQAAFKSIAPYQSVLQLNYAAKKVYGENFKWKSHLQYEAANAIQFTNNSLLINCRTGSGKTAMVLLPLLSNKLLAGSLQKSFGYESTVRLPTTLLIVPFVSLINQNLQLVNTFYNELTIVFFDPAESDLSINSLLQYDIVLIQLENAAHPVIKELYNQNRDETAHYLESIVVDEAHVLKYSKSYRAAAINPLLQQLKNASISTKVILLSGSVFSFDREELLNDIGVVTELQKPFNVDTHPPSSQGRVIADSFFISKESKFSLKIFDTEDQLQQYIKSVVHDTKEGNIKSMIFFDLINQLDEYTRVVGTENVLKFTGNLSREEKASIQKQFAASHNTARTLFSTTAGNSGIDFPGIKVVVLVGLFDIIDTVQAIGRAARLEGESAEIVFAFTSSTAEDVLELKKPYITKRFTNNELQKISYLFTSNLLISTSDEEIAPLIEMLLNAYQSADKLFQSVKVLNSNGDQQIRKSQNIVAARPRKRKRSVDDDVLMAANAEHQREEKKATTESSYTKMLRQAVKLLDQFVIDNDIVIRGLGIDHLTAFLTLCSEFRAENADAFEFCYKCNTEVQGTNWPHERQGSCSIINQIKSLVEIILVVNPKNGQNYVTKNMKSNQGQVLFQYFLKHHEEIQEKLKEIYQTTVGNLVNKTISIGKANFVKLFIQGTSRGECHKATQFNGKSFNLANKLLTKAEDAQRALFVHIQKNNYRGKYLRQFICDNCGFRIQTDNHNSKNCHSANKAALVALWYFQSLSNSYTLKENALPRETPHNIKAHCAVMENIFENNNQTWIYFCHWFLTPVQMVTVNKYGDNVIESFPFYYFLFTNVLKNSFV